MTFKLKSGNKTSFKEMGSSPLKQESMPKNFNTKGSSWPVKTPGHSSTKIGRKKAYKEFDKWHKTITDRPGGTTKSVISKKPSIHEKIGVHHKHTTGPEAMRPPKDAIVKSAKKGVKKSLGKTILKGAGKVAKFAAKRLGPIGAALTAYEVAKTIPKVAKATVKGLKKRAKSGNVNIGRKI